MVTRCLSAHATDQNTVFLEVCEKVCALSVFISSMCGCVCVCAGPYIYLPSKHNIISEMQCIV